MGISSEAKQRKRRAASRCNIEGCDQPKAEGRGNNYCETHKAAKHYERQVKEQERARTRYMPKERAAREPVLTEIVLIPKEIREVYGRADANSIIRRKYPKYSDLRKAYTCDYGTSQKVEA